MVQKTCQAQIPNRLLVDWLVKSLLPQICQDVAMSRDVTKEQVICRAQHLYLMYFQVGTLYNIIPHAPQTLYEKPRPMPGPHVDGVVGSIYPTAVYQLARKISQMTIAENPTAIEPMTNSTTTSSQTSEGEEEK